MIFLANKLYLLLGWVILLATALVWLLHGFSSLFSISLLASYTCFSIHNGSIKKLDLIKKLSFTRLALIIFAFLVSIAIIFGLIQLANFLINDVLHLTGWISTTIKIFAIILSLYPIKLIFGIIVYRVISHGRERLS